MILHPLKFIERKNEIANQNEVNFPSSKSNQQEFLCINQLKIEELVENFDTYKIEDQNRQ